MSALDDIVREAQDRAGVSLGPTGNRQTPRVLPMGVRHNERGRLERVIEMRRAGWGQRRVGRALGSTNRNAQYWIKKADKAIEEEEHAGS